MDVVEIAAQRALISLKAPLFNLRLLVLVHSSISYVLVFRRHFTTAGGTATTSLYSLAVQTLLPLVLW
jgi:hypothetical protein